MKNINFKLFLLPLFILSACVNSDSLKTNSVIANKKNVPLENNKVHVYNANKNDVLPLNLIQEVKFIVLKGHILKPSDFEFRNIKIENDHIYLLDEVAQEFYCYSINGDFEYFINLKSYQKNNRKLNNYFVYQNKVIIIDRDHRAVLTFDKDKLTDSKIIPYWISEVEINNSNDQLIIYQGFVNHDLGIPYYYLNTDLKFAIERKYFPVPKNELDASINIGTVIQHIFKTDQTINLLTDQNYHIYKYPNLKTPYYTFDFHKFNIDILKGLNEKFPSPNLYNFAMVDTFWENDEYILSSYYLGRKKGYTLHHKKSKTTFNRYKFEGINDFLLAGITGSFKNYFYRFIDSGNIRQLQDIDKNSHPYLKNLPTNIGNMPVIAFFKLKNLY